MQGTRKGWRGGAQRRIRVTYRIDISQTLQRQWFRRKLQHLRLSSGKLAKPQGQDLILRRSSSREPGRQGTRPDCDLLPHCDDQGRWRQPLHCIRGISTGRVLIFYGRYQVRQPVARRKYGAAA